MKCRICLLALLLALLLSACSAEPPRIAFADIDLSLADAGSGEKLFSQSNGGAPACAACHALSQQDGVGNGLAGIAAAAGGRVSGQSAAEYLYWSILRPGEHLVPGYADVMYAGYENSLEAADLADVIAYLLTLE